VHKQLSWVRSLAPYLLSALRIVAALSFITHGTQKLFACSLQQNYGVNC
jgi:uncharacterized membrane protein YphA (DoxX/SURF4 family)